MKNVCFAAMAALGFTLSLSGCYNDPNAGDSSDGGSGGGTTTGGGDCPNVGDGCYSEGARCSSDDLTCHCGQWLESGDATGTCDGQNPDTCKVGMACGGEGASCSGLTCHCGMWMSPAYAGQVTCGSGSGGSTGSGNPSSPSFPARFKIHAYAYHVWCEGGFVDSYSPDVADGSVHWWGPWFSFGGDVFGPKEPAPDHPGPVWLDYDVTVQVPAGASVRAQCYLNTNGSETSGDNVRYAFEDPTMLTSSETADVYDNGTHVYPPQGQKAYLVNNLDPQGFSDNIQVDP